MATRIATVTTARRLSPAAVRDLLLVGLTVSSGAVDAISFLALGKVFAAFMTGNVVFLGLGVAGEGGPDVVRVLIAIGAYAAGVYSATRIVEGSEDSGVWPRRVTVALGVALTLEAVFLVGWVAVSGQPGTGSGHVLTSLMALAMGLQSGAVMALAMLSTRALGLRSCRWSRPPWSSPPRRLRSTTAARHSVRLCRTSPARSVDCSPTCPESV